MIIMSDNKTTVKELKGNLFIRGKIHCETGLHIGGAQEKLEIGGVDAAVIRNPRTQQPYLPGSSLKGKLRHLLEFATGAVAKPAGAHTNKSYEERLGSVSNDEDIIRLFGLGSDEKKKETGPSRLIVRDANPDKATVKMWKKLDSELLYTELKPENSIDRLTAEANPRFIERVVAGSRFDFTMIYSVYQLEDNYLTKVNQDLNNLQLAMTLLESNALGKSGSRGYGEIRFEVEEPIFVSIADYQSGTGGYKNIKKKINSEELKPLDKISFTYNPAT